MTEVNRCSALDGSVTVWGLNSATGHKTELAFIDEDNVPEVEVINPRSVALHFENLVDIVRINSSVPGLNVEYKYSEDDPEARRKYQFWLHHPNDKQALIWLGQHFRTAPR